MIMKLLWLPLVVLTNVQAPLQTEFTFNYALGTDIPLYVAPFENAALDQAIQNIDPFILGQTQIGVLEENIEYTFTINITNEGAILDPLVGLKPFISSFAVNETQSFVRLFNPTLETLSLDNYGFVINDTYYGFKIGATLDAMTERSINLVDGIATIDLIDLEDPILTLFPIRHIYLREASTFLFIDKVDITDTIQTRNINAPIDTHAFQRLNTVTEPEETFEGDSWLAYPNEAVIQTHALWVPNVTPLIQAKAWAHYVMFGTGMNAAGRVEEAFRALETEYNFMDYRSQALLFEEPNTSFQGINERGRLDTSTFREAVGRYNYLAARVPGATGLINPNPSPFPINTLILIFLGLVGLFSIFAFIKSRYQRV